MNPIKDRNNQWDGDLLDRKNILFF